MNKADMDDKPSTARRTREVNASGVVSIALPLLGVVIGYDAAHAGRVGFDAAADFITGTGLWMLLSIAGVICAFVSFRSHGITATACIGSLLCLVPFLLLLTR